MAMSDGGGNRVDVDRAPTKVGEIVKQSWSTRELQLGEEGMRSLSPMGFGGFRFSLMNSDPEYG
jgi:hypothetical protein